MGDIADAIIDGELCQLCGAYCGSGGGFPTYCSIKCAKDHGADEETIRALRRELEEE